MSARTSLYPTILVIADDLKLVESLRGAFGSACQVFLSPNVEQGLKRVKNERLSAALIHLGLQGLDAESAVQAVRTEHSHAKVLIFTPPGNPLHVDQPASLFGCQVVPLPVDWKDMRHLLEPHVAPKVPALNGFKIRPEPVFADPPTEEPQMPASPSSEHSETTKVPPQQPPETFPPSSTFLRDEAALMEQGNWLEIKQPDAEAPLTGRILRLSPHFVVCETLHPQKSLAPGWAVEEATVRLAQRIAYKGPARLQKVVNTGQALISEWALTGAWHPPPLPPSETSTSGSAVLQPFLHRVRLLGRIQEVFKAVIADVVTVLEEARQCLDRIEVAIQPLPGQSQLDAQRALFPELKKELFPVFDQVFGKFEEASRSIPPDLEAEYHSLVRQRLHPLMMCSPFIHHIYAKPLGFAGDYAALQKLIEDPYEGHSLYARMLNAWLVLSAAGEAYRHRVALLVNQLKTQAENGHQRGMGMRVLSIGCGGANEFVRFLQLDELSHACELTLLDFSDATLNFAKSQVEKARQEHWRLARVNYVCMSLHGLVRDQARMRRKGLSSLGPAARAAGYDFISCTGLFDYFSDRVCRRLMETMHDMLAPGGRMIVCNFTPANPIRQFMKYILDWNLIHRTAAEMQALLPEAPRLDLCHSPGEVEVYARFIK